MIDSALREIPMTGLLLRDIPAELRASARRSAPSSIEPTQHLRDLWTLVHVREAVRSGEAKRLRQKSGLSLGEIGKAVGVGAPTVLRWENNERKPVGDAAVRYGDVLKMLAGIRS